MRRKFYKWGERLHSVVTLNFNVAHGHVYSKPSQYLIQQLERLWGATENIYYTRIAFVFIYFVLHPPLLAVFFHIVSLLFYFVLLFWYFRT